MDATRADVLSHGQGCSRSLSKRARTVINIPDTVGYTTPEEYTAYLRRLYELVPASTA